MPVWVKKSDLVEGTGEGQTEKKLVGGKKCNIGGGSPIAACGLS